MDLRQQQAMASQDIWNEFERLSPSQKKAIRQIIVHATQRTAVDFEDFHQYSDLDYDTWIQHYIDGTLPQPHGAFADLGAIETFVSKVLEAFIDDEYFQKEFMPETLQELFALYVELNRFELIETEEGEEDSHQEGEQADDIFIEFYRNIQSELSTRWVIEAERLRTPEGKYGHIDAYFIGQRVAEAGIQTNREFMNFRSRHTAIYNEAEDDTQLLLRDAIVKTTYQALERKLLQRMSGKDIELGYVSRKAAFNELQRFVQTGVSEYPILNDALELFRQWVESEDMETEAIEWADILGIYIATAHRDEHARLDFVTDEILEPEDINLNVLFATPAEWHDTISAVASGYGITIEGYEGMEHTEDELIEHPFRVLPGGTEQHLTESHDDTALDNEEQVDRDEQATPKPELSVVHGEGIIPFPGGGRGRRR